MANFTENRFINWSNHLELNFDPSLFTNIYSRYIDDFSSLEIEPSLTALCKEIRHQLPNVGFYLRGRFKSETSYICKTFLKLCDNILYKGYVMSDYNKHKQRTAVRNLREYIQEVTKNPNLETERLEVGDGLAITKKSI